MTPFQHFGSMFDGPDPVKPSEMYYAKNIFENNVIPAIAEVATALVRKEETGTAEERAAAAKMLQIWQEVFDLVHKRTREEYPDIGQLDRRVRDAWRW